MIHGGGKNMGYKITYGSGLKKQPVHSKKNSKLLILIVFALALVLRLSGLGERFGEFLLPGDPQVTADALQAMVQQLQEGEPLGDVFTAFCGEIIENAQILD